MLSQEWKLTRTGLPAIRFKGERIALAPPMVDADRAGRGRYYRLAAYRTQRGTLLAQVEYVTDWPGEHDHSEVTITTDLAGYLAAYDPVRHLVGYPPGEQYRAKQARLVAALRADYAAAVSQLLSQIPITEDVP